jgi:hypothetical protein
MLLLDLALAVAWKLFCSLLGLCGWTLTHQFIRCLSSTAFLGRMDSSFIFFMAAGGWRHSNSPTLSFFLN